MLVILILLSTGSSDFDYIQVFISLVGDVRSLEVLVMSYLRHDAALEYTLACRVARSSGSSIASYAIEFLF